MAGLALKQSHGSTDKVELQDMWYEVWVMLQIQAGLELQWYSGESIYDIEKAVGEHHPTDEPTLRGAVTAAMYKKYSEKRRKQWELCHKDLLKDRTDANNAFDQEMLEFAMAMQHALPPPRLYKEAEDLARAPRLSRSTLDCSMWCTPQHELRIRKQ